MLLPVTIVPRTVTFGVNAIVSGGTQAVSGLAMLNPQKWTGKGGVVKEVKEGEEVVFEVKDMDEIEETANDEIMEGVRTSENVENVKEALEPNHGVSLNDVNARLAAGSLETSHPSTPSPTQQNNKSFDRLQLLVSLDTALELIQVDRDSLKRAETFAKYPGKVGLKVKEAIEEIFIFLLKAVGDRHIAPGFKM